MDTNENGVQDNGEIGYTGIATIQLIDGSRDLSFVTSAEGTFASNDAALSAVDIASQLVLSVPTGFRATTPTSVMTFPTDEDGNYYPNPTHNFGLAPTAVTPVVPETPGTTGGNPTTPTPQLAYTGTASKEVARLATALLFFGGFLYLLHIRRRLLSEDGAA